MWRKRRRKLWGRRRWRRPYRRYKRRRYAGWRRFRRGVRTRLVTEYLPGRHETIWIRGWEPLGNLCHGDYATTRAEPYKTVEPQAGTGKWHGTWGAHYLTFDNLILRAYAYWNQWSRDWGSYDYIKFCGGTIRIPQTFPCTFMFNTDEYLQVKLKDYTPEHAEDQWIHPGIMINNPKTHIIFPPKVHSRSKMYKIPVKPPPGWKGFQRLPSAGAFICLHYAWTWCDLSHAFYDPNYDTSVSKCEIKPWWSGNQQLKNWVNRQKYQQCSSSAQEKSWGPYLPCKYSDDETSLFFLYRLKFKAVGNALWRAVPRSIANEGLVPNAPGPSGHAEAREPARKRKRPKSTYDIWPGDLDSHGLLKRRAFEKITKLNTRDKRGEVGDKVRRLKLISEHLRRILDDRGLLKRRGVGDNPPNTPP